MDYFLLLSCKTSSLLGYERHSNPGPRGCESSVKPLSYPMDYRTSHQWWKYLADLPREPIYRTFCTRLAVLSPLCNSRIVCSWLALISLITCSSSSLRSSNDLSNCSESLSDSTSACSLFSSFSTWYNRSLNLSKKKLTNLNGNCAGSHTQHAKGKSTHRD